MDKHHIPHVCMKIYSMRSFVCLFGRRAHFCFAEGQGKMRQHRNFDLFLWEENSEVKGEGWEWSDWRLKLNEPVENWHS